MELEIILLENEEQNNYTVSLLSIYDKSKVATITDNEIRRLIEGLN